MKTILTLLLLLAICAGFTTPASADMGWLRTDAERGYHNPDGSGEWKASDKLLPLTNWDRDILRVSKELYMKHRGSGKLVVVRWGEDAKVSLSSYQWDTGRGNRWWCCLIVKESKGITERRGPNTVKDYHLARNLNEDRL